MKRLCILVSFLFTMNLAFATHENSNLYVANVNLRAFMLRENTTLLNHTEIENALALSMFQQEELQSPETQNRVTFEKIALEYAGAAAGGTLLAIAAGYIASVSDNSDAAWVMVPVAIPVGTAVGATIVGNMLMEPNGSFGKSLFGSTIGHILGLSITIPLALSLGHWEAGEDADWAGAYLAIGLVVAMPISGAVIGYNHNIRTENVSFRLTPHSQCSDLKYVQGFTAVKINLISASF